MELTNLAFTAEELMSLRAETPGTEYVVHLNNAGAALMPQPVAQVVQDYLDQELLYGGYETAAKHQQLIESVYNLVARYLGCDPSEIALMENATVAWGQAFQAIPFEPGDIILTSMAEYASNYIAFLQLKKRIGVEIKAIPSDEFGQVDIHALAKLMTPKVKLIAITHVPTNGGLVNPAKAIGDIARQHQVYYLLDACQSVGQMPLNVKEIGCDFLSATSRKYLRGPRGLGFLYVNQNRLPSLEPPVLDLHAATWQSKDTYLMRDDARRFENWEFNLAAVLGLGAAVRYMLDVGPDKIWDRIQYLGETLRKLLSQISGIEVHDLGQIKSGIVSFKGPFEVHQFKDKAVQSGFNVSVIRADGTLLDMESRNLHFMIRASVHYYNSLDELKRFAQFVGTYDTN